MDYGDGTKGRWRREFTIVICSIMDFKTVLKYLPYDHPFLFVDELLAIDDSGSEGSFTFNSNLDFYQGHFKDNPVTPGVILTECCAQIGVVSLGIFLINQQGDTLENMQIGLSSSEMEFLKPVFPGEKVTVSSKKVYFRFNKLKCEVKMYNGNNKLVCKGTICGMLSARKDG